MQAIFRSDFVVRLSLVVVLAVAISAPAVVSAQEPAPPPVEESAGYQQLLKRIKQLEREIEELKALKAGPSPQAHPPAPGKADRNGKAEQNQSETQGEVRVKPFAILTFSTVYNTSAVTPGSIAFFVEPNVPVPTKAQFVGSPGDTLAGIGITLPPIGTWTFDGRVDFNFRGQTPVVKDNTFTPFFADLYIAARNGNHRLVMGQTSTLVAPVSARTLNMYPAPTMPGNFGGPVRPQFRYEYSAARGERTWRLQAAVAQPIQTYQVTEITLGQRDSIPDAQVRISHGHGSQVKTFEVGISGHLGRRRTTLTIPPFTDQSYTTWSGSLDLMTKVGPKTTFKGEVFTGQVLGDYGGGVLHTFNPSTNVPIRAHGGSAAVEYQLARRWSATVGYGLDDTNDRDLSPGFRTKNEVVFANVFFNVTSRATLANEVGYWRTGFLGIPAASAIRFQSSFLVSLGQ